MPSRAELRRGLEWLGRGAIIVLLAVALWRALHPGGQGEEHRAATGATLARTLREATATPRIGSVSLTVDSLPTAEQRAWLSALRQAGVSVRWHGDVPALALDAERAREPVARTRLLLVGQGSASLALADSAGALDSVRLRAGGASLEAGDVVGAVQARGGAFVASAALPTAPPRRDVLVLGRAGWESKFVLAALTEAGWRVRARLPAAPGITITDPGLLPIDTARYDVVVMLDSSANDLAPSIARFVAMGGGLVAAGGATSLDALRSLLPARAGARRPGRILLDTDSVGRADLPLRPLEALRADAVPLERQAGGLTVAARRAGRGRVLAVGYDESWRWRMLGGASGPASHRAWWSRTIGLVAPDHEVAASHAGADAAPTAALVNALGPASSDSVAATAPPREPLPLLLLAVIAAALLAETASRRFRGER
jgi:rhodanese-related sulfurtransferase